MNLFSASINILEQLTFVMTNISKYEFSRPLLSLNNASIGQHIRHTLEFFICLMDSYQDGKVCYDKRKHDTLIETDKMTALAVVTKIHSFLSASPENKPLLLEGSYSLNEESEFVIQSNFLRELAYNIEHAVHHMAIIKIGLAETNPAMELPPHFGVAVSTVRYKAKEAGQA